MPLCIIAGLDLLGTFWDHLQREVGGVYHFAKLAWNHCSSFDNTNVPIFCAFGFKKPVETLKMEVLGVFDPLNGEQHQSNPQMAVLARKRHVTYRSSKSVKQLLSCIFTCDSIYAIARICHGNSVCLSVCPSVRLSVCHTGGSVKNG